MDASLRKWRANVENQNKKLKMLREASLEKLKVFTARRSVSPSNDQENPPQQTIETVLTLPKVLPEVTFQSPTRRKSEQLKEDVKKTVEDLPEKSKLDECAEKILDVIGRFNQASNEFKINKIKEIISSTVNTNDSNAELDRKLNKYKEQLQSIREKCEGTTRIIADMENKLTIAEKDKTELRTENNSLIEKLNTHIRKLNTYQTQY